MFITSNESFNAGGTFRTPRELSGGKLPFMIHSDGLTHPF